MCEAILTDSKQIYPCSVYLNGEYGYSDVFSGVPVILGSNGVEEVLEVTLTDEEKKMFKRSVTSVKNMIEILHKNNFFK
jgi:malate dehydrogenase